MKRADILLPALGIAAGIFIAVAEPLWHEQTPKPVESPRCSKLHEQKRAQLVDIHRHGCVCTTIQLNDTPFGEPACT